MLLFASISFIFAIYRSTSTPHPPTHPLSLCPCSSLPPLHSHPFHLPVSLYIFACLSFPPPPLPPVLSFPAKRLAGVFSTVVTFKTECHHCLSCSLSSLPLTCFSPSLPRPPPLLVPPPSPHPPPAARAFWTKCCA